MNGNCTPKKLWYEIDNRNVEVQFILTGFFVPQNVNEFARWECMKALSVY